MEEEVHQFQNDVVELPFLPEFDDVPVDGGDFPFNVDFDFTFDDISFADDLLLEQPEPNSDPVVLGSDVSDPNSDGLGVRVYNCEPISSEESNFRGKCDSPEIGSSKSNSGVFCSGKLCDHDVSSSSLLIVDKNNDNDNDNDNGNDNDENCNSNSEDRSIKLENCRDNCSSGSDSISKCESKPKPKPKLKPKRKIAGELDHVAETRVSKFRRPNSSANGDSDVSLIDNEEELEGGGDGGGEDDKRKARLMRNRESAQLSRQRKKQYVEELEDKVRAMHSTITDLNSKISYFMTENATLRQQLGGVGGGNGGVAGPGVGVGPPGMYPMAPMPYPWMPYPPAYMVKPQGSHVPLVPIPRLKPQQPVSAPKVKKSSEGKKEKEKEKGERKTKKVASVSLLGLLFFMLLFGGLMPMVSVRYGRGGGVFGGVQKGTVFKVDNHVERAGHGDGKFVHGRVLQQSNSSNVGNASEPLVASLYVPRNDKLVKIDGNLIIHSVLASEKAMAAEGSKTSEETGLAIHGSYPPYPTPVPGSNNWRRPHLDRNQNGRQRALGSSSTDFTPIGSDGKLQEWFREGLAGPMLSSGMCTEVFQFDVSPTPGSIVPATSVANRTSEERLNSTRPNIPKNRRILHGHAIPFKDPTANSTEERMHSHEQNDGLQGNKSRSSVVVSVLVDPREVGDGDGESVIGSKTLPRIFVVVLIDSVKYVTYSCMLPFMGSGSHLITA
ncbi:bZIP transcription factor 39-like [Silene latifolia]|uniref:bZIP transcription factor 39-like n=1 Tax=Silene latifolia TaxID=37657 RepID=UPI003D778342